MNEYMESNRRLWNDWTDIHEHSTLYDVPGFKAGQLRLDSVERELGDVSGKTLLHLQCHFGLGTLSWARLGARVTGVDFSDRAIALARRLSAETGIPAEFVCADIYDLPSVLTGQFDVVFTSQGVLAWLPDLREWAQVVAHFLKPGGTFYLVEAHPFAYVLDDENSDEPRLRYPYSDSHVMCFDVQGSYADRESDYRGVEYSWAHGIGDILTSLIDAGLVIRSFQEYPFMSWKMLQFMEQDADGWWRLPDRFPPIPLMFSLRAAKPQTAPEAESN